MKNLGDGKQKLIKFSVLISVYHGDNPEHFDVAMNSVTFDQTLLPNEIVLVVDGPVSTETNAIITKWERNSFVDCTVVRSPINVGLSSALNLGLSECRYEYVARMDSDDISLPHRFELQVEYLSLNPNVALLGAWYKQFDKNMINCITDRKVPITPRAISSYAQSRTPFNHVTAIFKKSNILSVGGYPKIAGYMEDWWIALSLLKKGMRIENIPTYLVHVRGDDDFMERRGGIKYARMEIHNLVQMYRNDLITLGRLVLNIIVRLIVRLMPRTIRTLTYTVIRSFVKVDVN
ncbi:glycosyltransferase [Ketobacter sp. MCCC 1A13808]|uniref:glycosyltransferase n=1 Tax=Ketobacter sp. MCCC 1A13808 TaxID=2602738 RepID=UPI0012EC72E9|nr:glycosyltransferase [Ketobacter sp. MCCC 1A13808]MVF12935.1 glycosyltransferase [Ketobacter sp. MCCC 1A13808]